MVDSSLDSVQQTDLYQNLDHSRKASLINLNNLETILIKTNQSFHNLSIKQGAQFTSELLADSDYSYLRELTGFIRAALTVW